MKVEAIGERGRGRLGRANERRTRMTSTTLRRSGLEGSRLRLRLCCTGWFVCHDACCGSTLT